MIYSDEQPGDDPRATRLREQGHTVDVRSVPVSRSRPGQRWPLRALRMGRAYARAAAASASRARYDRLIVPTSPPFVHAFALARAAVTREPVTLLHHDLFPQNARVAGLGGPAPLFDLAEAMGARLAGRADRHETLSRPMERRLRRTRGEDAPVEVVPIPTDERLAPVPREHNRWIAEHDLRDKFVVMYAGNLGRMYDFAPLLDAAQALADRDDIAFALVGTGFHEDRLRDEIHRRRLDNVKLLPAVPNERLAELLCAGDLHVVPLIPGAIDVMWPHKIDNLLRLDRPTLALGFDPDLDGVETVAAEALADRIEAAKNEITVPSPPSSQEGGLGGQVPPPRQRT